MNVLSSFTQPHAISNSLFFIRWNTKDILNNVTIRTMKVSEVQNNSKYHRLSLKGYFRI